MTRLIRLLTIVAIVGMLAPRAGAVDRSVPEFDVTGADGAAVSSTALGDENNWLMIYIRPACAPCEGVVNLWNDDDPPAAPSRVRVIVGGATADLLPQIQAQYPMLGGAAWYADPAGAGARALALTGAPALFGMRGQTIAWTSQGLLPITRSQISGWVR